MTTNVNVDPVRAHAVFEAWGNIDPTKTQVAMAGTDLLDGAAFSLLKAEFLAAQAGVVPFVPLPGGGKGVLTVGGAMSQPANMWRGKEDPRPREQDEHPGTVVHACRDFSWWSTYDADAVHGGAAGLEKSVRTYMAVVPGKSADEAWSKVEATCAVELRGEQSQVADDWPQSFQIGFKGFQVRKPCRSK